MLPTRAITHFAVHLIIILITLAIEHVIWVLDAVLIYRQFHFMFILIHFHRYNCFHFTDKKTKIQRGSVTCLQSGMVKSLFELTWSNSLSATFSSYITVPPHVITNAS